MKIVKKIIQIPKYLLLFILNLYQKFLSPDHSFWSKDIYPHGYCKFHPTCSEYSKQCIKKYGAFIGVFKGLWRILRCNPWTKGGIDEV